MIVDIKKSIISAGRHQGHLRQLAHAVKTGNRQPLEEAARLLASFCNKKHVLVPVPNHDGDAGYTYKLALLIAGICGATVCDALQGFPRESSHDAKVEGRSIKSKIWFYRIPESVIPDRNVVLIDNCYATGATIEAARKALDCPHAVSLTITNAQRG